MAADDKPVTKNAAKPEDVKRAATREQRDVEQADDDMRRVLQTENGRRVIWRLLSHCGVYRSITVQNSTIYTLSGMRDVGLYLMAECTRADELSVLRMMQENLARDRQRAAEETDSTQGDVDE